MRIALKSVIFAVIGILVITQVPHSSTQTVSLLTVVHMQEKVIVTGYHSGDEEWAQPIFDTTVEALPILERLAGGSYPYSFDMEDR